MAKSGQRVWKANKKAAKKHKIQWKKGQSSSYNPKFNKHRLEAKKRGLFGASGGGNLTESALRQFNKINLENQCNENEDLMSIGGDTAVTGFTNCSLPTFNRLIQNWNVNSMLHKEMLAVLAAVTDVLKANDGKENETEYFAALMTTLDVVDTDEGVTAVICLLSMVVKKLSESVLKKFYKTSCETFVKLLIKYMNSDHGALLRNLLLIVYAFFKVKTQWTDESSTEEFKVVLEFSTHHKPKVRQTAHRIIHSLLIYHKPFVAAVHPGAIVAANFCIQKLEKCGGPAQSKDVFYMLSLLQGIIGILPKSVIKTSCETILRVMTLSNAIVTSSCLKALHGLFAMKPKPENLPVDLNARIITALYDYQPNIKDTLPLISWLQLMEVAFINLYGMDPKLCVSHLPKFFSIAVKCWQSEHEESMCNVTSVLINLLHTCIDPRSDVFQQILLDDPVNNPVHKMFHHVEDALSYQYHKAWKYVLIVIGTFFEVAGKHCYTEMLKCLQSLADMHDSYKFPCVSELEKTVGTAIKHMGPRVVLTAIPLQISGKSEKPDFPRSWLLPVLRDNIKRTELRFFIEYFMPLAAEMRRKVLALQQEGRVVESKLYDVICSQIWSLLPGFCTEPTDLKQSFREVARTLGIILKDDSSLRMTVLSSLRLLINKNLENKENKEEIAKFSKNYLPILFNLYTTETKDKAEEKTRLAVYETCKTFLQITDLELCRTFFTKALEKLNSSQSEIFMQHSLIDLCKAMLPYVDESRIKELYEYCKPLLKHTNHTIQKKSFSVLNELCSCKSVSCQKFVKAHLEELRSLLCSPGSGLPPATKALRLNCFRSILNYIEDSEKDFVISIIPEAVLYTKENSVKARNAAYSLLIDIAHTLKKWSPQDKKGALREFMKILFAGLAGSPHMMSATVLAIARIIYEFKDELDSDIIHLLAENMCLLITSKSREVVDSALSFFKVLFRVVDTSLLLQHVEVMVKNITSISEDNQRHFRFKAKELFTRLIRKFGYEMISKLAPDAYKKQLTNIRKIEARRKSRKGMKVEDDDDEELDTKTTDDVFDAILADSDDESMPKKRHNKEKKASKKANNDPCIEEQGEKDIVDFMDPSVNKKLLSRNPEVNTEIKKIRDVFPISEDGKLIIEDQDDFASKSKIDKNKSSKPSVMSALGAASKKKRKFEEDTDDEEFEPEIMPGAKKGIHRSIQNPKKKIRPGEEFKAKKAGGDIKKGKIEPYAYVPFNKQALNRRKQGKMKGQFKNFVKAAKKGASIGVKRKAKQVRRKKNSR